MTNDDGLTKTERLALEAATQAGLDAWHQELLKTNPSTLPPSLDWPEKPLSPIVNKELYEKAWEAGVRDLAVLDAQNPGAAYDEMIAAAIEAKTLFNALPPPSDRLLTAENLVAGHKTPTDAEKAIILTLQDEIDASASFPLTYSPDNSTHEPEAAGTGGFVDRLTHENDHGDKPTEPGRPRGRGGRE